MNHWIIVPVRNNLHLTRRAIETFRAQDIGGIHILVIDNDSTDGTTEWLNTQPDLYLMINRPGLSVAASWNTGLRFIFGLKARNCMEADYALVVNNDVELRPDTYRHLVADGGLFVTAVGTNDPEKLKLDPNPASKSPHPDFSCFLIRREAWRQVGEFDEKFRMAFCEDWDYHVRLHKAGVKAECLDLPFLHHGSATIKLADDAERDALHKQAELNRDYFASKWGVRGGTPEYYALFDTPVEPEPEDP